MKMLHVITGLATGGAERVLLNLLAGGLAERFDNVVISLSDEGTYGAAIRDLGVPVHALNTRRGFPSWHTMPALRRVVAKFSPDVIQGWMYHGNLAGSLAGWLSPTRSAVVWSIHHSLDDLKREKPLTRQVIRTNRALSKRVNAIVYCADTSRQQHETFGFASARAQVIRNGFDLAHLGADHARGQAMRCELALPAQARLVGHVARLHPMKDHARFLRAALRVAAERGDVHFLLIGTNVTADNSELTANVPERLRSRFHFLGDRDDVPNLMRTMDILCLSSGWGEAFPNVLGEAMATEVPCVATDVGDCAALIGETGVIVPPQDDEVLHKGLSDILGRSAEERHALGQAARARVEARYSLASVVADYAELYENLNTIARPTEIQ